MYMTSYPVDIIQIAMIPQHFPRSEYADTLVTELDLVCDYAQWPHISTSLFYVGSLLGNIIFGNIADRYEIV